MLQNINVYLNIKVKFKWLIKNNLNKLINLRRIANINSNKKFFVPFNKYKIEKTENLVKKMFDNFYSGLLTEALPH